MRHIAPAFAAFAAAVLFLPRPALAQRIKIGVTGQLTSPAVCDGVVYFGCDNGKLYAVKASDGSAMPGFPVDIASAVGDGSHPYVTPTVYFGSLGKAIYLGTSKHGLVKVWPDGSIAWVNRLDGTSPIGSICLTAVTSTGDVITEMRDLSNVYLVKLKESDGSLVITSPPLATDYFNFISAPAVVGSNIYTTISPNPAAGGNMYITVLNLEDFTVKAAVYASGIYYGPPYVRGNGVFYGSNGMFGERVFKLNAVTLNPDSQFGLGLAPGIPGVTQVTPNGSSAASAGVYASPVSADRDPGGTVYAAIGSSLQGHVVAIDATSGKVRTLYSSGSRGGEMVVSSRNVIAYCDGNSLQTFGVDGGHYGSFTLPDDPGRPCYDPTTNRFFVATTKDSTGTSYLMGFDSP